MVDDGSNEPNEEVIKSIPDPRIKYVRHSVNRGASAARNTGIKIAKGEYVAFLDSDDEWLPDKLGLQLKYLKSKRNDIIAGCTGFVRIRDAHKKEYRPPATGQWQRSLLKKCGLGPGSTLMATRTAFEKTGLFDEEMIRLEDWDWLLRYTENYHFACLSTPLAKIHLGKAPSASLVESSMQYFIGKHRKRIYRYGRLYGRKVLALRYLELASYWYRENKFSKGHLYFLKAFSMNPFQRIGTYLILWDSMMGSQLSPLATKAKEKVDSMLG